MLPRKDLRGSEAPPHLPAVVVDYVGCCPPRDRDLRCYLDRRSEVVHGLNVIAPDYSFRALRALVDHLKHEASLLPVGLANEISIMDRSFQLFSQLLDLTQIALSARFAKRPVGAIPLVGFLEIPLNGALVFLLHESLPVVRCYHASGRGGRDERDGGDGSVHGEITIAANSDYAAPLE